jgi:phosphatidylinositol-3-phosphatase
MENHNWTQPSSLNGSIDQIYGDSAAPFINSLVTPGNANAQYVSYASNYYQPGQSEHPSEPNYVWEEAGTNFNPTTPNVAGGGLSTSTNSGPTSTTQGTINGTTILNDNDSSAASGNIFPTSFAPNHLTGQLNAAGITWKNYQEDYQILNSTTPTGGSPTVSKSGTSTTVQNPYNGSFQYNYAEKHNPMAFFADTANQNVNQLSQLSTDLSNDSATSNTVGEYNWITPNQYNDMHTALNGGFTYHGTAYTGDQAQIAQGDNFLSIVVPEIEASYAFQHQNGTIIIWNDETEGGDSTAETSMEIVISKDAKGNAYTDSIPYSHSSDIQTIENLNNLTYINNPIPTSETYAAGGYATVSGATDLSDLFVPGAISPSSAVPEPTTLGVLGLGTLVLLGRRRARTA